MRFRQINKNNNKFHYWGFIDGVWQNPMIQENYINPEDSDRCTDLKDRCQNLIYERDFLDSRWDVVWMDGEGCWYLQSDSGLCVLGFESINRQITGNAHTSKGLKYNGNTPRNNFIDIKEYDNGIEFECHDFIEFEKTLLKCCNKYPKMKSSIKKLDDYFDLETESNEEDIDNLLDNLGENNE